MFLTSPASALRFLVAALLVLFPALFARAEEEVTRIEFTSFEEVLAVFEDLNYTPDSWADGNREVPRVVLANIPARWRESVSGEIATKQKKQIFFRTLAPLALMANEVTAASRERLLAIIAADGPSAEDETWLKVLAMDYGVIDSPDMPVTPADYDELLRRVDIVPVSLVLAQAAEESGWGTSRFADEGNAIFGQWTWGGEGIAPEEQRDGMGDYKIKAFDSPMGSVEGYMRNINTHFAYEDLRMLRASIRAEGRELTGWELAGGLESYSERGMAYVDSLREMIDYNKLAPTDETYLADGPTIVFVPVGEGSE